MVTSAVFAGLPPVTAAALWASLPRTTVAAGALVVREGTANRGLYLVESGSLAVWKGRPDSRDGVQLARLGPGACIGEMTLVRAAAASVSVVATTEVQLRELSLAALPAAVRSRVALNLARLLAHRLRQTETAVRQAHQEQVRLKRFATPAAFYLIWNLVGLAAGMFSLPLVAAAGLGRMGRAATSVGLVAFFGLGAWQFARRNAAERTLPGVPAGGRRWRVLAGLASAAPLFLAAVGVKAVGLQLVGSERPLFDPLALPRASGLPSAGGWAALAIAVAVLGVSIEFVRCGIQRAVGIFFRAAGQETEWAAITVAAILCAALQVHFGVGFAWLNLGFGLFWGSLFASQRSFLAVAVSHAAVCVLVCLVLGFP